MPQGDCPASTRAVILQLLRNWKDPYSTGPGSAETDSLMFVENRHLGGNAMPLNKAVRKRGHGLERDTYEIFGRELYRLAIGYPKAYAGIREIFLHEDASDAAYEHYGRKAKKYPDGRHAEVLAHADRGIEELSKRLDGRYDELYVEFVVDVSANQGRQAQKEASYAEVYRVYESWCTQLRYLKRGKPYKQAAKKATADQLEVSMRTVERAITHEKARVSEGLPEDRVRHSSVAQIRKAG